MKRLENRVAVVTGAASGIGRAVAQRFSEEGAAVMLLDVQEEALKQLADQLPQAKAYLVDVTNAEIVQRVLDGITQIDIVFSGVGVSGRKWGDGPAHQCDNDAWNKVLDIDLTSMFYVVKYALQKMLANKNSGSIITLASVLGMVGGDDDFATHAYAASKSGIIGFTRAVASYYAKHRIRANVIAPGLIATPMSQRAQSNEHILKRLETLQPLTGEMGLPEDIAGAAAYLASDDSKFVTGTVLTVDGGWTMR